MTSPYEEQTPTRRLTSPEAERLVGVKFPCLDRGFVYLVDYMGGDASIVQAARVSYGIGTKTVNEDRGLIRYLMRHAHTTPFEMVDMKFHLKMPIFVARQMIRHRTACLAGDSMLAFDLPSAQERGRRQRHNVSIADFHRMWHEPRIPMRGPLAAMKLRMCDERTGEIGHTSVVDVWESGVKPVFRVTLENGNAIKMTKDHRCLTEAGWATLECAVGLSVSESGKVSWRGDAPGFAVNGVRPHQSKEWLESERTSGLSVDKIAAEAGVSFHTVRKSMSRFEQQFTPSVFGAYESSESLVQFQSVLEALPRIEGKRRPAVRKLVRTFAKVAKIELAGQEMTYDLEVAGPYHNFVANGFIVHNSVNEYSGRYSIMPDEFYVPAPEHVSVQSQANRQGGGEQVEVERAAEVVSLIEREQRAVREGYEQMLEWDIRRELARVNLGVAQYTEWYWKNDLHNIFHFLRLRLDDHAQYEIRVFAEAMAQIVKAVAPIAYEAFEDYVLDADRFSGLELEAIRRLLGERSGGWPSDDQVVDAMPEAWRQRGADGQLKRHRERDEFLAKLERLREFERR